MSYHLSPVSRKRLEGCHPFIQVCSSLVLLDHDFTVLCGPRTRQEQDDLLAAGKTKLAGNDRLAKHVVGVHRSESEAIDVAPWRSTEPHVLWPDHALRNALARARYEDSLRDGVKACQAWGEFTLLAAAFRAAAKIVGAKHPEWQGWSFRWGGNWDGDYELSDNTFNDLPHLEILR